MEGNKSFFNLLSSKRYFHLIAFKGDTNYSMHSFWNDCGVARKANVVVVYENTEFGIQQAKYISDTRYYNGEDFENIEAPYAYDLIAIEIKHLKVLVIGFPFKGLAKNIIDNLIDVKKLLKKGSFVKTDLNKLIKLNQILAFSNDHFTSHFSGVELTLTGDTNISSVNLDGEKPLESSLYKTVFLKKIDNDECKLEKCSLKCETIKSKVSDYPNTKSNIHFDLFGNYKLYIHGSGNNIFTIPFIFNLLGSANCLEYTFINPINRLNDE